MKVNFHNQTETNLKKIIKGIKKALKREKSRQTMEVIFVSEQTIKDLNNQFRNIDEITDVISFPSDEEKSLGDVFICVERAISQANEYQHSEIREFAFLAVHGYLHLLGFDHQTKADEKVMFELQAKILSNAKIERK